MATVYIDPPQFRKAKNSTEQITDLESVHILEPLYRHPTISFLHHTIMERVNKNVIIENKDLPYGHERHYRRFTSTSNIADITTELLGAHLNGIKQNYDSMFPWIEVADDTSVHGVISYNANPDTKIKSSMWRQKPDELNLLELNLLRDIIIPEREIELVKTDERFIQSQSYALSKIATSRFIPTVGITRTPAPATNITYSFNSDNTKLFTKKLNTYDYYGWKTSEFLLLVSQAQLDSQDTELILFRKNKKFVEDRMPYIIMACIDIKSNKESRPESTVSNGTGSNNVPVIHSNGTDSNNVPVIHSNETDSNNVPVIHSNEMDLAITVGDKIPENEKQQESLISNDKNIGVGGRYSRNRTSRSKYTKGVKTRKPRKNGKRKTRKNKRTV